MALVARFDLSRFTSLNEKIVNDILFTLAITGHKFEGELERSFKLFAVYEGNHISLHSTAVEYIDALEYGIAPQEFDESKVNTDKLQRWVDYKRSQKDRFGKPRRVPGVNRLIKLWKQNGYELSGAIAYSQRTSVMLSITETINKFWADYVKEIDEQVFDSVDDQFFKIKSGKI